MSSITEIVEGVRPLIEQATRDAFDEGTRHGKIEFLDALSAALDHADHLDDITRWYVANRVLFELTLVQDGEAA